jgi:hypothetical protein
MVIVAVVAGAIALLYSLAYLNRADKVAPPEPLGAVAVFTYNTTSGTVTLNWVNVTLKNPTSQDIAVVSVYASCWGPGKVSGSAVVPARGAITINATVGASFPSTSLPCGTTLDDLYAGIGPLVTVATTAGPVSIQATAVVQVVS